MEKVEEAGCRQGNVENRMKQMKDGDQNRLQLRWCPACHSYRWLQKDEVPEEKEVQERCGEYMASGMSRDSAVRMCWLRRARQADMGIDM